MFYYKLYLIVTFLAVHSELSLQAEEADNCSKYTNCKDCETLGAENQCGWDGTNCLPEVINDPDSRVNRCFQVLQYCLSNYSNEEEPSEPSQSLVNVYLDGYTIDSQNESLETFVDEETPCEIIDVQGNQFQCKYRTTSKARGDSIEVKIFDRNNPGSAIIARKYQQENQYYLQKGVSVTSHVPGHIYKSWVGKIGIVGSGFTGINLSKEMIFCLDGKKCLLANTVNDSFITCQFGPFDDLGPTYIGVKFPNHQVASYCKSFSVMRDPNISRPAEKDTLNSAKRVINYTGENFRAFWRPQIVIYMEDGQASPFETCEIKSEQSMMCPTPDISKFYPTLDQDMTFKVNFTSHMVDVTSFTVKFDENRELNYRRDPVIQGFTIVGAELEIRAELPPLLVPNVSIRSMDSINETIRCGKASYTGIRMTCPLNLEPDMSRKWRLIMRYSEKTICTDPGGDNNVKGPWPFLIPIVIGFGFLLILVTVAVVFIRAKNKPKRTVNINPFTGELDVDADTFTGYTLYSPRTQFTKTTTSSGKKSKSGRSYGSGKGSGGSKPK